MFYQKKETKAYSKPVMKYGINKGQRVPVEKYELRQYIADNLISKGMDLNKFNQIIGVKRKK